MVAGERLRRRAAYQHTMGPSMRKGLRPKRSDSRPIKGLNKNSITPPRLPRRASIVAAWDWLPLKISSTSAGRDWLRSWPPVTTMKTHGPSMFMRSFACFCRSAFSGSATASSRLESVAGIY
jgi:hypothetical protein